MPKLSVKAVELKGFVYITAVVFALFMVVQVAILDRFAVGWKSTGRIPVAITLTTFSWIGIVRWAWKIWPFRLFLGVPVLEGSWTGHLQSDWTRDMKGAEQSPIPIVFAIRQDLLTLTVLSFTENRHGISHVAQVLANDAADMVKLVYLYSLCEEFRAGGGTQQGAAEVRLVGKKADELRGEYWTNMKTRGRVIVRRQSRHAVASFQEATSNWSKVSWTSFSE